MEEEKQEQLTVRSLPAPHETGKRTMDLEKERTSKIS